VFSFFIYSPFFHKHVFVGVTKAFHLTFQQRTTQDL